MKSLLIICFLLSTTIFALGQNVVQAEYFLDADKGVGKNTLVNLAPAADGQFPFTVNLVGVQPGYHKLYIRTKDSDNNWSLTVRRNIEVLPAETQYKIISGEYFFDKDPGFGAGIPIIVSPQDSAIFQSFNTVTAGLSIGYHKLYGRFKDIHGNWSQTFRRNMEVINNDANNIIRIEYFITEDPGVGSATKVDFTPPNDSVLRVFNLKLPCLDADSSYFINMRVQDAHGNWSLTTRPIDKFAMKDASTVTTKKAGNWSDPTTWSNNLVPDANTIIYLNHDVTVDINATCKLLWTLCHEVNVNTGKTVNITGTLKF